MANWLIRARAGIRRAIRAFLQIDPYRINMRWWPSKKPHDFVIAIEFRCSGENDTFAITLPEWIRLFARDDLQFG